MSNRQTLKDLHSATSSQELEDGQEPCSLPGGVQTDLFGQEVLLVSHSQQQESNQAKKTSDISGQCSLISSESANLQQSLVSKLQAQLDLDGLTIYKGTWKQKVTPQQRSYYQVVVSQPRTKGTGSSSWLTPTTSDMNGVREMDGKRSGGLNTQAQSAWPTPMAADWKDRGKWDDPSVQRRVKIKKSIELSMMVGSAAEYRHAKKSPWATPTTQEAKHSTPTEWEMTTDHVPTANSLRVQANKISGQNQKSSTAGTENTAPSQLNPRFSLWLMGYPIEWAYCAERVTQSSRKRQQKS